MTLDDEGYRLDVERAVVKIASLWERLTPRYAASRTRLDHHPGIDNDADKARALAKARARHLHAVACLDALANRSQHLLSAIHKASRLDQARERLEAL